MSIKYDTSQFRGSLINAVGGQGNWDESRNLSKDDRINKGNIKKRSAGFS